MSDGQLTQSRVEELKEKYLTELDKNNVRVRFESDTIEIDASIFRRNVAEHFLSMCMFCDVYTTSDSIVVWIITSGIILAFAAFV